MAEDQAFVVNDPTEGQEAYQGSYDNNASETPSMVPTTSSNEDNSIPLEEVIRPTKKSQLGQLLDKYPEILNQNGINTPVRVASFLAQLGHESGLNAVDEKPSQYASSQSYYHGRGYIQLTGQSNYQKYGNMIGEDLVNNPEKANDPLTALKIAAAYWNSNGLNEKADKGDYAGISTAIGGNGYHGQNSRYQWLGNVLESLSKSPNASDIAEDLTKNPKPLVQNNGMFTAPGEYDKIQKPLDPGSGIDLWQYLKDNFTESRNKTISGSVDLYTQQVNNELERINKVTNQNYSLPKSNPWNWLNPDKYLYTPIDSLQDQYNTLQQQIKSENPEIKIKDFSDLKEQAGALDNQQEVTLNQESKNQGWVGWLSGMLGSFAGNLSDPTQNLSYLIGGGVGSALGIANKLGGGILANATQQAVSFSLGQSAEEPLIQSLNAEKGQQHGLQQAAEDIAGAAGTGATVSIGSKILGSVGKYVGSKLYDIASRFIKGTPKDAATVTKSATDDINAQDQSALTKNIIDGNPAGKTPDAQHDLNIRLDKATSDIDTDQRVTTTPTEVSGVKDGPMPTDLSKDVGYILKDEGYVYADKAEEWFKDNQLFVKSKGNVTQQEFMQLTPPPVGDSISNLEKITKNNIDQHERLSETYSKPEEHAKQAMSVLKSDLPVINPDHPEYELVKRKNEIDRMQSNITRDKTTLNNWEDISKDESKPEHLRNDTAKDHVERRLSDNGYRVDELKQQYEDLHKTTTGVYPQDIDSNYTPSERFTKQEITPKPAVPLSSIPDAENRISNVSKNAEISKDSLQKQIDDKQTEINGLNDTIVEIKEQKPIALEKLESVKAQYDINDPFDNVLMKPALHEWNTFLSDLDNQAASITKRQNKVLPQLDNLKNSYAMLDNLTEQVKNLTHDSDITPLTNAEALLERLRNQDLINRNSYARDLDINGNSIKNNYSNDVNKLGDTVSALKQLKDCINNS